MPAKTFDLASARGRSSYKLYFLAPLGYSLTHVPRSTYQARLQQVQAYQLLVKQEQEVGRAQDRAQKVLQMVPGFYRAQRGKEIKNGLYS